MTRGLMTRIMTALVVLPVTAALIWVPGLQVGFLVFVGIIACVGLREYFAMIEAKEIPSQGLAGVICGTLIAASGYFGELLYINIALMAALLALCFLHIVKTAPSVAGIAATAFGVVYVGWFPAHLLLLHADPETGAGLVTVLLVAIALSDTAAYFVGKSLGRRPLAPIVSPKKTQEGSIGGFIGSIVGMLVLYALRENMDWSALPDWSALRYAGTGAVISIVSQIGDLVASSIKRDAGVKDAGSLFPGHGGALDRCDGFLFGAPVLYYMAVY